MPNKTPQEILFELQHRIEQSEFLDVPEEDMPLCPVCEGIRHIKAEPSGRIIPCPQCNGVEFNQLRERIYSNRLKKINLPKRYTDAQLSDWGNPMHKSREGKVKAFCAMQAMVNHPAHRVSAKQIGEVIVRLRQKQNKDIPEWLIQIMQMPQDDIRAGVALFGDYGVGKTWLAAAAMNAMSEGGQFVLYMRISSLIQTLRDTWKSDDSTGDLLRKYSEVPVLFIDDMSDNSIDDKPLSPHQQEFAATIMRQRMGDERPTIITTNWSPNQFALKWGQVCADVMFEGLHWIEVSGVKLRDTSTTTWGDLDD